MIQFSFHLSRSVFLNLFSIFSSYTYLFLFILTDLFVVLFELSFCLDLIAY